MSRDSKLLATGYVTRHRFTFVEKSQSSRTRRDPIYVSKCESRRKQHLAVHSRLLLLLRPVIHATSLPRVPDLFLDDECRSDADFLAAEKPSSASGKDKSSILKRRRGAGFEFVRVNLLIQKGA